MYNLSEWINSKYLSKEFIINTKKELLSNEFVKVIVFDNFFKDNISNKIKTEILNIWKNRAFSFNESDEMNRNSQFWYNWEFLPDNVDHYFYKWAIFSLLNNFLNSDIFLRYLSIFYWKKITYQNIHHLLEFQGKKYAKYKIIIKQILGLNVIIFMITKFTSKLNRKIKN